MVNVEHVLGNTGCLRLSGNCVPFYRVSEKEWILLDSGSRFARKELSEVLEAEGITVKAVLCSHAHFDHTENNRFLQERCGAQIIMTPYDAGSVHDALALKSCFYSHTVQENWDCNREMLCHADRVLPLDARFAEVCGVHFGLVPLPGHAASHLGVVTPDRVIYLADAMFSRDMLHSGSLFYMLSWSQVLKTLEKIKGFRYERYILSHYGVEERIKELAEENISRFHEIMEEFYNLCGEADTLEGMVSRVVRERGHVVKYNDKARLYERIVRSMVEYLAETGRLTTEIRDGVLVYRKEDK